MIKKYAGVFFSLIMCWFFLVEASTSIEIRGAAFFPASHRFREVYENIGGNYQVELSTSTCICQREFNLWANFDWYSKKNKKHDCCDYYTRVEIPTISGGLKYYFPCTCFCSNFDFYLGLGVTYSRIHLKSESCCVKEKKCKDSIGGVIKSGINYYFCRNFFLDVFVDYVYQPVSFHKHVDVGGLKVGGGLGYSF